MFVINVDLWNSDGNSEVNLVRHTTVTPSVINAALLSYNEPKPVWAPIKPGTEDQVRQQLPGFNPSLHQTPTVNPYANASGVDQNAAAFYNHGQTPTQRLPPSSGGRESERQPYGAMTGAQTPSQGRGSQQLTSPNSDESEQKPRQQLAGHPQPTGMFTRNLIGSLATNAFSLTDTEERIGIWFVLQDLSVRTEGTFRYVPAPPIRHSLLFSPIKSGTDEHLQPPLLIRKRRRSRTSPPCHSAARPQLEHEPKQYQRRQGAHPCTVLQRCLRRLLGQEIPWSRREYPAQQVLRYAGHQDPDSQGWSGRQEEDWWRRGGG